MNENQKKRMKEGKLFAQSVYKGIIVRGLVMSFDRGMVEIYPAGETRSRDEASWLFHESKVTYEL